jgi:predicted ArsR family transcriptional regulator
MDVPPTSAITEALADHGPATGPELAALLDAHPVAIERRCSKLQQRGHIRQGTGGMYTLVRAPVREQTASD